MTASFTRELEVACELARRAGELILRVYNTPFSVIEKAAGAGPVTQADYEANALIVSGLKAAFPGDDVIAEESALFQPTRNRIWFVDPLDGTREFVARNGMFAVHIGLAIDGVPVVGVVYSPAQQALWIGARGHEATVDFNGQRRRLGLAQTPRRSADLRLLVSRSHRSKKTEAICRALHISDIRQHGSVGLKCALVAMSEADVYLHPSAHSSRWDSCAPQAVLEAAGGILVDFGGQPYRYDGHEIVNGRGLVACSPQTWELIAPQVVRIAHETGILTSSKG